MLSRPTWTSFGLLGDGTDDVLKSTLSATISGKNLWAVAVFRIESYIVGHRRAVSLVDTVGGSDTASTFSCAIFTSIASESNFGAYRAGVGNESFSASATAATKHIIESRYDATNHTFTLNGVDSTPVADGQDFGAVQLTVFSSNAAEEGNYSIAELLIGDRLPNSQEIRELRTYLKRKWVI